MKFGIEKCYTGSAIYLCPVIAWTGTRQTWSVVIGFGKWMWQVYVDRSKQ